MDDYAAALRRRAKLSSAQLTSALATVRRGRILFLHQSVGANILAGIRRLDEEAPEPGRLRIGSLEDGIRSAGPMLIDLIGGRNGEPKSKVDFFASVIRDQPRLALDLAFMKLCYVDFNPRTDADELFGYYRKTLEALKRERGATRFAHATVPLVVRPAGLKWRIFRLIGKEVWEDAANAKRAEFNRRLAEAFASD